MIENYFPKMPAKFDSSFFPAVRTDVAADQHNVVEEEPVHRGLRPAIGR